MVRKYKKKTGRCDINEEDMKKAIDDILSKKETPTSASLKYKIKRQTLNSRIKKYKSNERSYQSKFTGRQVFTKDQEIQIVEYLKKCSRLQYGLSCQTVRNLAFDYAKRNRGQYPTNWNTTQKAGIDWLGGFMRRNPSITLRKPEKTSLARLTGFNKTAVDDFFQNLKSIYEKHLLLPKDIYNLDETGVSTVMDPPKVIAEKGQRSVSQAVSGERGTLTTVVGIVNASGNYIEPVYIFPRMRYSDRFMSGCIPGSLGLNSKSGWMTADIFPKVLHHIKQHTNCSPDNPILLLLDNHSSHCTLESILYCRDNGIILLSFPPHTSHRLQPLDVTIFGPFKTFCRTAFHSFMVNIPGKNITIYDICDLTSTPFYKAFSPENIVKGFKTTGIFPFNSILFSDNDFLLENGELNLCNEANIQGNGETPSPGLLDTSSHVDVSISPTDSSGNYHVTPEYIRPIPRILLNKPKLNRGKSRIYTTSPEMNIIGKQENRKQEKRR